MTDRLSLTNALTDANIDRQKAERIATEIFDAIHDNVATKADLQQLKVELTTDLQQVKVELTVAFETRVAQLEHRLVVLGVRALVVAVGLILAAIRYLPPAGHG
jgi:hypothetical protein